MVYPYLDGGAMPMGITMRKWLATVGLLGAVGTVWGGAVDGGRHPSAFVGTIGRISRDVIGKSDLLSTMSRRLLTSQARWPYPEHTPCDGRVPLL